MVKNESRTTHTCPTTAAGRVHEPVDASLGTRAARNAAIRIADHAAGACTLREAPTEEALFMALQACAFRAAANGSDHKGNLTERREWAGRWKLIRDYIVEQNLGLAYSLIGHFRAGSVDWDELRSEAFYALVRAVEGFNPSRGFRFSTYACNAIARALIYITKRTREHRLRFPVEHDASFERPTRVDDWSDLYVDRLNRALDSNLGELTGQETTVLGLRFPTGGGLARTLGEVGHAMGLSKERVRQIQKKALRKLRQVLDADPVLQ